MKNAPTTDDARAILARSLPDYRYDGGIFSTDTEEMRRIKWAVSQLSDADRNILVLYAELQSIDKTAAVFGVCPRTIIYKIKSIRAKINEHLDTLRPRPSLADGRLHHRPLRVYTLMDLRPLEVARPQDKTRTVEAPHLLPLHDVVDVSRLPLHHGRLRHLRSRSCRHPFLLVAPPRLGPCRLPRPRRDDHRQTLSISHPFNFKVMKEPTLDQLRRLAAYDGARRPFSTALEADYASITAPDIDYLLGTYEAIVGVPPANNPRGCGICRVSFLKELGIIFRSAACRLIGAPSVDWRNEEKRHDNEREWLETTLSFVLSELSKQPKPHAQEETDADRARKDARNARDRARREAQRAAKEGGAR